VANTDTICGETSKEEQWYAGRKAQTEAQPGRGETSLVRDAPIPPLSPPFLAPGQQIRTAVLDLDLLRLLAQ
jgi:hypothetical protein